MNECDGALFQTVSERHSQLSCTQEKYETKLWRRMKKENKSCILWPVAAQSEFSESYKKDEAPLLKVRKRVSDAVRQLSVKHFHLSIMRLLL